MRRIALPERGDWKQTAERYGFRFHTIDGQRYWDESAYYAFTLQQIDELIALDASEDRARARALAEARVAALDDKIAQLTGARDALRRLARECGDGTAGRCPILESFEAGAA